ncbi:hypothetical protein JCM10213_002429 [Rhodosporidiobolus nylandii]
MAEPPASLAVGFRFPTWALMDILDVVWHTIARQEGFIAKCQILNDDSIEIGCPRLRRGGRCCDFSSVVGTDGIVRQAGFQHFHQHAPSLKERTKAEKEGRETVEDAAKEVRLKARKLLRHFSGTGEARSEEADSEESDDEGVDQAEFEGMLPVEAQKKVFRDMLCAFDEGDVKVFEADARERGLLVEDYPRGGVLFPTSPSRSSPPARGKSRSTRRIAPDPSRRSPSRASRSSSRASRSRTPFTAVASRAHANAVASSSASAQAAAQSPAARSTALDFSRSHLTISLLEAQIEEHAAREGFLAAIKVGAPGQEAAWGCTVPGCGWIVKGVCNGESGRWAPNAEGSVLEHNHAASDDVGGGGMANAGGGAGDGAEGSGMRADDDEETEGQPPPRKRPPPDTPSSAATQKKSRPTAPSSHPSPASQPEPVYESDDEVVIVDPTTTLSAAPSSSRIRNAGSLLTPRTSRTPSGPPAQSDPEDMTSYLRGLDESGAYSNDFAGELLGSLREVKMESPAKIRFWVAHKGIDGLVAKLRTRRKVDDDTVLEAFEECLRDRYERQRPKDGAMTQTKKEEGE